MTSIEDILRIILIGGGATLVMDLWLMILNQLGVQTLNFALIGRWLGHLFHGRVAHASISKATPIHHETLLGWMTHYAVGVSFAFLLIWFAGETWARAPTFGIGLGVGMGTVIFPLFIMQPAMGLGFAASKTPAPVKNCIRSLINHSVFGVGLFLSACFIEWISR